MDANPALLAMLGYSLTEDLVESISADFTRIPIIGLS